MHAIINIEENLKEIENKYKYRLVTNTDFNLYKDNIKYWILSGMILFFIIFYFISLYLTFIKKILIINKKRDN
jgi:hypothetical protein